MFENNRQERGQSAETGVECDRQDELNGQIFQRRTAFASRLGLLLTSLTSDTLHALDGIVGD